MTSSTPGAIELVIDPPDKDLGEFTVRRSLPHKLRQRVGPFIFWDHMGPAEFPPGAGVTVRPHPHIGLATITYLFEGVIVHRDSLGYVQPITSGAVNWMTAGKGIVHSERSPEDLVASGSKLHGIQAWVALPTELEETEPRFEHYPADDIPRLSKPGLELTVIAGEAFGAKSPVQTSSKTVYVEADMEEGASLVTPAGVDEIAVYAVRGAVEVDGQPLPAGRMAILSARATASVSAQSPAKVMILGGGTLQGERLLSWNFVSSFPERLEQARQDWKSGKFDDVPGDPEFIPLPER
jgi:redox-sensitive bicupin YhaK (pirin superfamily)